MSRHTIIASVYLVVALVLVAWVVVWTTRAPAWEAAAEAVATEIGEGGLVIVSPPTNGDRVALFEGIPALAADGVPKDLQSRFETFYLLTDAAPPGMLQCGMESLSVVAEETFGGEVDLLVLQKPATPVDTLLDHLTSAEVTTQKQGKKKQKCKKKGARHTCGKKTWSWTGPDKTSPGFIRTHLVQNTTVAIAFDDLDGKALDLCVGFSAKASSFRNLFDGFAEVTVLAGTEELASTFVGSAGMGFAQLSIPAERPEGPLVIELWAPLSQRGELLLSGVLR